MHPVPTRPTPRGPPRHGGGGGPSLRPKLRLVSTFTCHLSFTQEMFTRSLPCLFCDEFQDYGAWPGPGPEGRPRPGRESAPPHSSRGGLQGDQDHDYDCVPDPRWGSRRRAARPLPDSERQSGAGAAGGGLLPGTLHSGAGSGLCGSVTCHVGAVSILGVRSASRCRHTKPHTRWAS